MCSEFGIKFLYVLQKLTNDVDKAQQEKTDLEKQLIQKVQASPEQGHSDHDWRILESRLKVCQDTHNAA